jgi:hypothetical protein
MDARSRGRTEAELAAAEARIGFRFPEALRSLLRQQNGGAVRYSTLPDSPVSVDHLSGAEQLMNFREYLLTFNGEDDVVACESERAPFHPERLVIFSSLDGHSCAGLDYGYRQAEPRTEPEVVFLGDDGGDLLGCGEMGPRFASFDALLDALEPGGDFAERTFIGLVSPAPYATLVTDLEVALGVGFAARTDDRSGHFDFDSWHTGSVPLFLDDDTLREQAQRTGTTFAALQAWAEEEGRTRYLSAWCSPNQRRSGTFLFHEAPELCLVLEVAQGWFDQGRPMARLLERLRAIPSVHDVVRLSRT